MATNHNYIRSIQKGNIKIWLIKLHNSTINLHNCLTLRNSTMDYYYHLMVIRFYNYYKTALNEYIASVLYGFVL